MAALAQLLAAHDSILVLDAASATVQIGLLRRTHEAIWEISSVESGQSIFTGTADCLRRSGLTLREINAFVYCEGPGSMLGIRTAVMAIRTWQAEHPRPAYAYQSLAVAGQHDCGLKPQRGFTIIADARRESWHAQEIDAEGRQRGLRRLATMDLPSGELLMPEHFRTWSTLPPAVATCSYTLAKIFPALVGGDFFRETAAPDVFQHAAPEYKKWSATVHRAATAPSGMKS